MFNVGDEVVCVDNNNHPEWASNKNCALTARYELTEGAHYIVRWVGSYTKRNGVIIDGLRLAGMTRQGIDTPFSASRFRLIKPEQIQVFRQMCASKKPLVPVE